MALDEVLAERVRIALAPFTGLSERKMMGGLCFMVNGNMCCGVDDGWLFIRTGREEARVAMQRKHAGPMVVGGRTMTGFVKVEAGGLASARSLRSWVVPAAEWAATLPQKVAKTPRKKGANKKTSAQSRARGKGTKK